MLSRNIVTFEMSDGVGKTFRAIYFKLFFPLLFQKYTPTFSTNPDSVCVFWTKALPHGCFEYWVISAKVLESSPCSKESKHFVVWPSVYDYITVHITHVFNLFPILEHKTETFKTYVHFLETNFDILNTAWTLTLIYCI